MSMISYSLDSIFSGESEYVIIIDMQALLKIDMSRMSMKLGSSDLIFCKEPRYVLGIVT
jgi:hypothetical protein